VFVADPQVLGVDAVKGSEQIFPVVFKTLATKQYAPVREFRRRVRLALEENHMLPGDPFRVYTGTSSPSSRPPSGTSEPPRDPTTIKPQESNPFNAG
jgi:small conductance mechanosensitive channel